MSTFAAVAIVSGGSRGLGAAIVADLLAAGFSVATFSRSRTKFIEETERAHPGRFYWEKCDASDQKTVTAFVLAVKATFGTVDALVNCAAVAIEGLLTLTRTDEMKQMLDVNLLGPMMLTQACAKIMLSSRKGGSVVNITSINGVRGFTGVSVYGATKAALDSLTRALAKELGPQNIRVNSVAPGYFESEMSKSLDEKARTRLIRRTPLSRLGNISDMVGIVRFLLSREAQFITGQLIVVDGGLTC
jgi:3-oxoacyl-[acyl-carrier protein] reductase